MSIGSNERRIRKKNIKNHPIDDGEETSLDKTDRSPKDVCMEIDDLLNNLSYFQNFQGNDNPFQSIQGPHIEDVLIEKGKQPKLKVGGAASCYMDNMEQETSDGNQPDIRNGPSIICKAVKKKNNLDKPNYVRNLTVSRPPAHSTVKNEMLGFGKGEQVNNWKPHVEREEVGCCRTPSKKVTAIGPMVRKVGDSMEQNVETMIEISQNFDEKKGVNLGIFSKGRSGEVMKLTSLKSGQSTPSQSAISGILGNILVTLVNGVKEDAPKMSNVNQIQSQRQGEGNEKRGSNSHLSGTSYVFGNNRKRSKSDPWWGGFTAEHRTT